MANLNFQQPPRISSATLSGRSSGFNAISGHVTPTSGMFPSNNSNYVTSGQQQQPQQSNNQPPQLSPNRNLPAIGINNPRMVADPMSRINLYTSGNQQRAYNDRSRAMAGLGSGGGPMVSINKQIQENGAIFEHSNPNKDFCNCEVMF